MSGEETTRENGSQRECPEASRAHDTGLWSQLLGKKWQENPKFKSVLSEFKGSISNLVSETLSLNGERGRMSGRQSWAERWSSMGDTLS